MLQEAVKAVTGILSEPVTLYVQAIRVPKDPAAREAATTKLCVVWPESNDVAAALREKDVNSLQVNIMNDVADKIGLHIGMRISLKGNALVATTSQDRKVKDPEKVNEATGEPELNPMFVQDDQGQTLYRGEGTENPRIWQQVSLGIGPASQGGIAFMSNAISLGDMV